MSLLSNIITVITLWGRYGASAEKAISIVQELAALDSGKFFENIDTVLKNNGIDLSKLLIAPGAPPDLTKIDEIQRALNKVNPSIVISITGQLDFATDQSVMAFQKMTGLKIDGKPGPATCATLIEYLGKIP